MKVVIFSINPIFPKLVTGGASKHLYHIASYLGQEGHTVEIVCAQAEGLQKAFDWAENVTVRPILPFHLPFPQPYAISGGELALIVDRLAEHLQSADRFYIHDGEFLLPDLYANIPTVISFRDNIYPESILGSFIGRADDILCVSEFSAAVIAATAGRYYHGLSDRIHQVNNGIDYSVYKPVDTTALAQRLGVDPVNETILLHPHRPEPGKGLPETIRVADHLVHQYGIINLKILVPEWIGSMVSSGEMEYYAEMLALMDELGVRDHFQYFPWISQAEMPALYSLGRATLCLGSIVEAFGNVAYESLACGTPSIVSKVGVHRTLLPDGMIDKVAFGDTKTAAEKAFAIVQENRRVSENTIQYIYTHLDFEKQVGTYADVIINAAKQPTLKFASPQLQQDRKFVLAPWCYIEGDQVFNDFSSKYSLAEQLKVLGAKSFSRTDAKQVGTTDVQWENWIGETIIVPEFEKPKEMKE